MKKQKKQYTYKQADDVKEWLKRGVCLETAEIMAGVRQSDYVSGCNGSEQPLLQEERD